jgi:amino-acid N-acetyltransferase
VPGYKDLSYNISEIGNNNVASKKNQQPDPFVDWFRSSSPYIHAHRGGTFVIVIGGEAVAAPNFAHLIQDIALLQGLGIRVVLVHGARPQVEQRLKQQKVKSHYVDGLRITDDVALTCIKEAVGAVRVEIEGALSMGVANSPMAGARIRVLSGNFVTAKPIGVRNGVDFCLTGEVRRVDVAAIGGALDSGAIVLIPPLGYSATGDLFNLNATDVGGAVAAALDADKLIYLNEGKGLTSPRDKVRGSLLPSEVDAILKRRSKLSDELSRQLRNAAETCRSGVSRAHLISLQLDGALLRELFTRDGVGTLITAEPYETIRSASLGDVVGILELLSPLEERGVLVRRPREMLETEIDHFSVAERDGMVIACAAIYCYGKEQMAELACVAVHPEYQHRGLGDMLLTRMEERARDRGMEQMFVLTTQTAHWFRERGFKRAPLKSLPVKRRQLYNYQRNSNVLFKSLGG